MRWTVPCLNMLSTAERPKGWHHAIRLRPRQIDDENLCSSITVPSSRYRGHASNPPCAVMLTMSAGIVVWGVSVAVNLTPGITIAALPFGIVIARILTDREWAF